MKASQFFLATLRETPSDCELISHQLMIKAGMLRRLSSGLYTWLPLGLRVLRRVEQIVREEMDRVGALELLLPIAQPAELWQTSGRWDNFGPLMIKFQDRTARDFCLGPTHEEVVTELMSQELKSYKQLPLNVYQIQTKFRDEIRPRFGVMRAREFLMKDAYSFHLNQACLAKTYAAMYQAYTQIFTRLGMKFCAVAADTGAIGGLSSHEFHAISAQGEDTLVMDEKGYAANLELAESLWPDCAPEPQKERQDFPVPDNCLDSSQQADSMSVPLSRLIKVLLVKGRETAAVALCLCADDELNEVKAEKLSLLTSPIQLLKAEEIAALGLTQGFIGPIDLAIPVVVDKRAAELSNFSCGSNTQGLLYQNVNWSRDCPIQSQALLRRVRPTDLSLNGLPLEFKRGIEIGHIFQLGNKYSEALNCRVQNELGQNTVLEMGCYGIGVSRIVAALIEQNHDAKGICWPKGMAPFDIVIIPLNSKTSTRALTEALKLYEALRLSRHAVLLDDRPERPGVLFNDSELIGIPHRVVFSERSLAQDQVEYKARSGDTPQLVALADLQAFLQEQLNA